VGVQGNGGSAAPELGFPAAVQQRGSGGAAMDGPREPLPGGRPVRERHPPPREDRERVPPVQEPPGAHGRHPGLLRRNLALLPLRPTPHPQTPRLVPRPQGMNSMILFIVVLVEVSWILRSSFSALF
jgi:hypothetical protein